MDSGLSSFKRKSDLYNHCPAGTVVPPNTDVPGTGEKPAGFRNGGIGREYITLKNPIWDLEWAVVLGGTRY